MSLIVVHGLKWSLFWWTVLLTCHFIEVQTKQKIAPGWISFCKLVLYRDKYIEIYMYIDPTKRRWKLDKRPMGDNLLTWGIVPINEQIYAVLYDYTIKHWLRKKTFVPSLGEIDQVVLVRRRIFSKYCQCIFIIISSWKRVWPFIWINLSPGLHQRIFCVKFGREWPSRFYTLEKISIVCHGIFAVSLLSSLGKDCGPLFV